MTASHMLNVLIGVAALSTFFVLVYWTQEKFKIDHRQRLKFLKINLVMTWLVSLIPILILTLSMGKVIGQLLPVSQTLQSSIVKSKVQSSLLPSEDLLSKVFISLYLLGLSVMLVRFFLSYMGLRKLLLSSSQAEHGDRKFRVIDSMRSPFSFGFLNPQIFVPAQFLAERNPEEIDVMLTHEETHLKNGDPQWVLFSLLTRTFLFFTPTAFYLHRKLELEIEIRCDQETMQRTSLPAQQYGTLLIDTISKLQNNQPMFTYMSNTNLKERISAMKTKTFQRPFLAAVFGTLVVAGGLTAIATTSGITTSKELYKVKAELIMNGKLVSTPQFVVSSNEPAEMEVKSENPRTELKMKVVASNISTDRVSDGIDLKMAIYYRTMSNEFRANPRIVVAPGEEGTVMIGTDATESLEVKVKAERQ